MPTGRQVPHKAAGHDVLAKVGVDDARQRRQHLPLRRRGGLRREEFTSAGTGAAVGMADGMTAGVLTATSAWRRNASTEPRRHRLLASAPRPRRCERSQVFCCSCGCGGSGWHHVRVNSWR